MTAPLLRHLITVPADARRLYPRGELHGLEPAQLQVLIALTVGDVDEVTGLSRQLAMNRTTVSHALRVLLSEGLAARSDDPDDGRRSRFATTPKGDRVVSAFAASRRVP